MASTENDTDAQVDARDNKNDNRYANDFPEDITPALKLLEEHSGIPPDQVVAHTHAAVWLAIQSSFLSASPNPPCSTVSVLPCLRRLLTSQLLLLQREKAWQVHPYACVGRFRFLDLSISLDPIYPTVLSRLKDSSSPPQTLLDLGCCFGQDIRRLVADGAPSEDLYGADLRPEYLELGYELFRDKGRLNAHFLVGDVFDDGEGEGGNELKKLDGKIDIIHAASFLHLFTWDEQVQVGMRMVRLFRTTTTTKDPPLVFGTQAGSVKPGVYYSSDMSRTRYRHDPESFQNCGI